MSIESTLHARSNSKCELCDATQDLGVFDVPPHAGDNADNCVLICVTCRDQIDQPDPQHWRCLSDSMWSQEAVVQVMAWRLLNRLNAESWAQDLLDMLYLDEETLAWAQAAGDATSSDDAIKHLDSNGAILAAGDTVTLIKDLNVKGANFTAKRGTAVRNISLVPDNSEQIEGRVSGQQIVILTEFVKKST
jgi:protein PhnA